LYCRLGVVWSHHLDLVDDRCLRSPFCDCPIMWIPAGHLACDLLSCPIMIEEVCDAKCIFLITLELLVSLRLWIPLRCFLFIVFCSCLGWGDSNNFSLRGFLVSWLFGLVNEGLWQSEVASFQALQINKLIHWVEVFLEICPLNLHTECQSAGFIFTAACRGS